MTFGLRLAWSDDGVDAPPNQKEGTESWIGSLTFGQRHRWYMAYHDREVSRGIFSRGRPFGKGILAGEEESREPAISSVATNALPSDLALIRSNFGSLNSSKIFCNVSIMTSKPGRASGSVLHELFMIHWRSTGQCAT